MNTWGNRPYHSLNYHYRHKFSDKTYKIAINANLTCPNRDGTLGSKGCIFCSKEGSGEFTQNHLSIIEQIDYGIAHCRNKNIHNFIAYFQAYTNTYGDIHLLKKYYTDAINHPNIVSLAIATRPDCLSDKVLLFLNDLNKIKPVTIELGLQTIHNETATFIRRGYSLDCFDDAVKKLKNYHLEIIVHLILGLPNETKKDILESVNYIANVEIDGIKLHLLHILKDTDLATYYSSNPFKIMSMDEYIDLVIDIIEILPKHIVIHRMTGDGKKEQLIEPLWSLNKRAVLNGIHKRLKERQTYQARFSR